MTRAWKKGGLAGLTVVLGVLTSSVGAQEPTRSAVPAAATNEGLIDPALIDRLYAEYCQEEKAKHAADNSGALSATLSRLNAAVDRANQQSLNAVIPSPWDNRVLLQPARPRFFDVHFGGQFQFEYSDAEQAYELRRR